MKPSKALNVETDRLSSCPVRLLAPFSHVQLVSPYLRGMVTGCGQDHGDGLLLLPQGSTQPSLPAAPITPDAAHIVCDMARYVNRFVLTLKATQKETLESDACDGCGGCLYSPAGWTPHFFHLVEKREKPFNRLIGRARQ